MINYCKLFIVVLISPKTLKVFLLQAPEMLVYKASPFRGFRGKRMMIETLF